MNSAWRQSNYSIRLDWGLVGGQAIALNADVAVVIDVLSFSTAVTVAIDRGAVVYPYPLNERSDEAKAFAFERNAKLATRRSMATPDDVSLSPVSIRSVANLDRIVLPSPNGSTISAELQRLGAVVVVACFRNRRAVAEWLGEFRKSQLSLSVAIIAAGERWPDGSLRPAIEDWWGAGALAKALIEQGWRDPAPEAFAAAASFAAIESRLPEELDACASGRELGAAGYNGDVTIAAELDRSDFVPMLTDGCFDHAGLPFATRSTEEADKWK